MRRETSAWLWDAREAIDAIGSFVDGVDESEFTHSLLIRSAVERQLEVLGEALNRVRSADPETAALIADIHRIIAMRNVIAHQYGEIDYAIVWPAVNDRVPQLRSTIAALLSD